MHFLRAIRVKLKGNETLSRDQRDYLDQLVEPSIVEFEETKRQTRKAIKDQQIDLVEDYSKAFTLDISDRDQKVMTTIKGIFNLQNQGEISSEKAEKYTLRLVGCLLALID